MHRCQRHKQKFLHTYPAVSRRTRLNRKMQLEKKKQLSVDDEKLTEKDLQH